MNVVFLDGIGRYKDLTLKSSNSTFLPISPNVVNELLWSENLATFTMKNPNFQVLLWQVCAYKNVKTLLKDLPKTILSRVSILKVILQLSK